MLSLLAHDNQTPGGSARHAVDQCEIEAVAAVQKLDTGAGRWVVRSDPASVVVVGTRVTALPASAAPSPEYWGLTLRNRVARFLPHPNRLDEMAISSVRRMRARVNQQAMIATGAADVWAADISNVTRGLTEDQLGSLSRLIAQIERNVESDSHA